MLLKILNIISYKLLYDLLSLHWREQGINTKS